MRRITRREMLIESAVLGIAASKLGAVGSPDRQLRVTVLDEPTLPRLDAPANLAELLQNSPDAKVTVVDASTVARDGIQAEVFCNIHGSAFPAGISDRVYDFIARGGSLLHVGGVPFESAYVRTEGKW